MISLNEAFSTAVDCYLWMIVSSFVTFLIGAVLVLTKQWHGKFTYDLSRGVQKVHTSPTPRVGGLAIILGLLVGFFLSDEPVSALFEPMLFASLPAFAFGFFEDLSKKVGITERLLACIASGALAWWLTEGVGINRTGLWIFDLLLTIPVASLLITALAVAGLANAINMIDGFHGLATGITLISLASVGFISFEAGDYTLARIAMLLCCVSIAFLSINFPFGKLFLGDGGAYLLGFLLAWMTILLVHRNPSVEPLTAILILAVPVVEVVYTVIRRLARKKNPGLPDRLHLHSLIRSRITERFLVGWPVTFRNASVAPLLWLLSAIPNGLALFTWTSQFQTGLALLLSTLLYVFVYNTLIHFHNKVPRKPKS